MSKTKDTKTIFKPASASRVEISELMLPSHSNFSGKIHGGYILSLLDQIAFACASKHSGSYCVTASVDTVDFLKPIEIGELVTMKASINFVGNTSMVVGIRVEAENIQNGAVKHCNSSYITMVAKDDKGKSVKVPGLVLESKNDLKRFFKSIKRMELKKERQKYSSQLDYTVDQVIHELEGYNVKIDL
ncbi:acyl-CoA thioesterase [Galbibacter sp. EGI 63066]|uniref:acyl-CoA thioesterase n=1 Tax=Galbibacter sp. EGI 63066 TaxID=2993559 RepID=UPI002248C26A|nr:acyl-CoA thioesterase [Galbibacter sp. EGI 63066]MCX2678519.1 acyl-CoA thioesterase [Galbibacter sp. EGI 63066]